MSLRSRYVVVVLNTIRSVLEANAPILGSWHGG